MAFDVSTITLKGAELLAAATSSDKFIVVGCDADTNVLTQQQAIYHSNRPASPVSNTTEVTPINHYTINSIYIRAYFRAGETIGGSVNTLYLYGHLESDSAHDYVIFIASASTSFHLPEVGDVMDEWEARLSINYNPNTDSIAYATSATYATQASIDALEDRMVSVHAFNSLTQGDNQNIYGIKTFLNGLESEYISLSDDAYLCLGSADSTRLYGDAQTFDLDQDGGTGYKSTFHLATDNVSGNIETTLQSHGRDLVLRVNKAEGTNYRDFYLTLKRSDSSLRHTLTVEPTADGATYINYEVNLGSSTNKFNALYTGLVDAYEYKGRLPYIGTSDTLPPIGGIFLAILECIDNAPVTYKHSGFILDLSTSTAYNNREYDLYEADAMPINTSTNVTSFGKGRNFTTQGTKYVLLCGYSFAGQSVTNPDFLVLVQRIL